MMESMDSRVYALIGGLLTGLGVYVSHCLEKNESRKHGKSGAATSTRPHANIDIATTLQMPRARRRTLANPTCYPWSRLYLGFGIIAFDFMVAVILVNAFDLDVNEPWWDNILVFFLIGAIPVYAAYLVLTGIIGGIERAIKGDDLTMKKPPASSSSASSSGFILDLYFSPRTFFRDLERLRTGIGLSLVTWVSGITFIMNQIEKKAIRSDFGYGSMPKAVHSWAQYWLAALALGALAAVALWYVAGWWYKKRLAWSGAAEATSADARTLYVYQDLVQSAPAVLVAVAQTAVFQDYLQARDDGSALWGLSELLFPFWSTVVSYKAATASFALGTWRAGLWFLLLPCLAYLIGFGAVSFLYSK